MNGRQFLGMRSANIGAAVVGVAILSALVGCGREHANTAPRLISHSQASQPVASRRTMPPSPMPTAPAERPRLTCLTWAHLRAASLDDAEQRVYLTHAPAERRVIREREVDAPGATDFLVSRMTTEQVKLYMTGQGAGKPGLPPFVALAMSYHPPIRRLEPDDRPPGYYSIASEVIGLDARGRQIQDYVQIAHRPGELCGTTLTLDHGSSLPTHPGFRPSGHGPARFRR